MYSLGVLSVVGTQDTVYKKLSASVSCHSYSRLQHGSFLWHSLEPFKGQRCQLVTLGHPGLTYVLNFGHSGTLALSPECQGA